MSETWLKGETLWTVAVLVFRLAQAGFDYERGFTVTVENGV